MANKNPVDGTKNLIPFTKDNQPSRKSKSVPKTVPCHVSFQGFLNKVVEIHAGSKRMPMTLQQALLKRLEKEMLDPKANFSTFIKSFEFALDRAFGKAPQTIQLEVAEKKDYCEYEEDELMFALYDIAEELLKKGTERKEIHTTVDSIQIEKD